MISGVIKEEIMRWTTRRKSALVLETIQDNKTVAEASRQFELTPSEIESWVDEGKRGMKNAWIGRLSVGALTGRFWPHTDIVPAGCGRTKFAQVCILKAAIKGMRRTMDYEKNFRYAKRLLAIGRVREALSALEDGVMRDHADSCWLAANIYEDGGNGVAVDYGKAWQLYKKSVEISGAWYGIMGLGRIYFHGKGVTRDLEKAKEIYQIAYDSDPHPLAGINLARSLIALDDSAGRAEFLLRDAAASGYVAALYELSNLKLRKRRYISFLLLRVKVALQYFRIAVKDKRDIRLNFS